MFVGILCACLVPAETRRVHQIPWNCTYDSYELPCVLETEHDSSGRALSALKHRVTSQIPRMITFYVEIQNSFTTGLTSNIQRQELWKEAEDQKIQTNQT